MANANGMCLHPWHSVDLNADGSAEVFQAIVEIPRCGAPSIRRPICAH